MAELKGTFLKNCIFPYSQKHLLIQVSDLIQYFIFLKHSLILRKHCIFETKFQEW